MQKKNKPIDVSIILPCLNEAQALSQTIKSAKFGLQIINKKYHLNGEIIVVDNGSTDQSLQIAKSAKVKLIRESKKGYGSAYKTGMKAASGKYLIMSDSDGTYDLTQIAPLYQALANGSQLVLGSRFMGHINDGAMPLLNQHLGNPLLTRILNLTYGCRISDAHTGLRAITKTAYQKLSLTSDGMEFASEMIIKANIHHINISEIPIVYRKRLGMSKLSPIADAWRHIKCMIWYTPTYVFIVPGLCLFLLGMIITIILYPGKLVLPWFTLDIHTLTLSMLAANLGFQIVSLGMFARLYTQFVLKLPGGKLGNGLIKHLTSEILFTSGLLITSLATFFIAYIAIYWASHGFGQLFQIRQITIAGGLMSLGVQVMFSSFLFSLVKDSG